MSEAEEGLVMAVKNSKMWNVLLIILAAFLTFAGPTYVSFVFIEVLKLNYFLSMAFGFALFLVGLALILYLVKNKVVS